MDSRGKYHLIYWSLTICIPFCLVTFVMTQQFDSLTQRVTFYPAALMVSHSPKPLTFYQNAKPLNVHTVLNFTGLGNRFLMSNNSCSEFKTRYFDHLLETARRVQKVARRLLSLPGFSTLIECDTYLPRYFQVLVGQPSKRSCPRVYRSSFSECKT